MNAQQVSTWHPHKASCIANAILGHQGANLIAICPADQEVALWGSERCQVSGGKPIQQRSLQQAMEMPPGSQEPEAAAIVLTAKDLRHA